MGPAVLLLTAQFVHFTDQLDIAGGYKRFGPSKLHDDARLFEGRYGAKRVRAAAAHIAKSESWWLNAQTH